MTHVAPAVPPFSSFLLEAYPLRSPNAIGRPRDGSGLRPICCFFLDWLHGPGEEGQALRWGKAHSAVPQTALENSTGGPG